MSFNAFKTVMNIDTLGTFNVSRVLYEKFFWVSVLLAGACSSGGLITDNPPHLPTPMYRRIMEE